MRGPVHAPSGRFAQQTHADKRALLCRVPKVRPILPAGARATPEPYGRSHSKPTPISGRSCAASRRCAASSAGARASSCSARQSRTAPPPISGRSCAASLRYAQFAPLAQGPVHAPSGIFAQQAHAGKRALLCRVTKVRRQLRWRKGQLMLHPTNPHGAQGHAPGSCGRMPPSLRHLRSGSSAANASFARRAKSSQPASMLTPPV